MTTGPTIRFTVEIDPASYPIHGWVQSADTARTEFVGLVELVNALEALGAPPPEQLPPRT